MPRVTSQRGSASACSRSRRPSWRKARRSPPSSEGAIWSQPAIAPPATPRMAASPLPAGARFRRRSGRSIRPTSRRTRKPASAAGRTQDFYKAMHEGVRRDGKQLYPAFPYPWYTKVGVDDVRAIKAYLDALPPVKQTEQAVGSSVAAQHPRGDGGLERALLSRGHLPHRSEQIGAVESRRLSGRGPRALRRMPHAEELRWARRRRTSGSKAGTASIGTLRA